MVERSRPFIGALTAALPTAGGAAMIILAWEHPPAFIAEIAVGSVVANAVVAVFALSYAVLAQSNTLLVSISGAYVVWFGTAFLTRYVDWNAASAALLNAVVYPLAIVGGGRFRVTGVVRRAHLTAAHRRTGGVERGRAPARAANRPGFEPAGRAHRRVVFLRGGPIDRHRLERAVVGPAHLAPARNAERRR